jgi:hypothetical protein
MFRTTWLYHIPIYLACIAAGAGGTWYLTKASPSVLAHQDAAAVPRPVHTVSWFKAHRAEARQKNAECDDNPGEAMHDVECINADQARGG